MVGQLEALIGEHPYRERLRAQLMLALYRSDRQADALQAYQDARRTLVEELGIEPGERLRELERAILAQDPGLHLAAEQPAADERQWRPRGAPSWAASASWRSWSAVSMMPSPAAAGCSCSPASPGSARAGSPRS